MAGAKNLRYVCVRAARTPGRALPSFSLWANIYLNHQLPPSCSILAAGAL